MNRGNTDHAKRQTWCITNDSLGKFRISFHGTILFWWRIFNYHRFEISGGIQHILWWSTTTITAKPHYIYQAAKLVSSPGGAIHSNMIWWAGSAIIHCHWLHLHCHTYIIGPLLTTTSISTRFWQRWFIVESSSYVKEVRGNCTWMITLDGFTEVKLLLDGE